MRKSKLQLFLPLVMFVVASMVITSCSSKLTPLPDSLFNASPSPLELVGTKVPVTVTGKFPEKWFNKNAVVTITPVLKYQGGELYGTSQTYQGENVSGNGITVPQNLGGSFNLRSQFDYIPELHKSELYLRFKASIKNKTFDFPDVKVADGVVSTAALATAASTTPAEAPDKFQRIIKEAHDANIMFLIQQADLRSSELNSSNLAAWKDLVKSAYNDERRNVDVEVSAYASPDGGYELNEGLSEKREKNTSGYLSKEFNKNKLDVEINAKYTAQDWDGFKKLVEASNLQDKDLVLRVLSMYPDPEVREREIKNISAVYSELAETILPQLRRSRLTANVEIIGKTDEELFAAVNNGQFNTLSIEELLYAATLAGAPRENIYSYVTQKYPNDYRGWNNLGAYYYESGDMTKASQAFNKALNVSARAAEPNMNLALNALSTNDVTKAEQLLGNASQANTINEALGLLYIKKGDYVKAVDAFGDTKSDNAAVAQILTKNYNKAQQTLDGISNKTANTYYLAAVVAARTNNAGGVASNLRQAIQKDPQLKRYALTDLEFAKFMTNPDIANMLR
ncbi:MAG: tetratricopeptide repeat protein [Dysgonomonas sp.]